VQLDLQVRVQVCVRFLRYVKVVGVLYFGEYKSHCALQLVRIEALHQLALVQRLFPTAFVVFQEKLSCTYRLQQLRLWRATSSQCCEHSSC